MSASSSGSMTMRPTRGFVDAAVGEDHGSARQTLGATGRGVPRRAGRQMRSPTPVPPRYLAGGLQLGVGQAAHPCSPWAHGMMRSASRAPRTGTGSRSSAQWRRTAASASGAETAATAAEQVVEHGLELGAVQQATVTLGRAGVRRQRPGGRLHHADGAGEPHADGQRATAISGEGGGRAIPPPMASGPVVGHAGTHRLHPVGQGMPAARRRGRRPTGRSRPSRGCRGRPPPRGRWRSRRCSRRRAGRRADAGPVDAHDADASRRRRRGPPTGSGAGPRACRGARTASGRWAARTRRTRAGARRRP